VTPVKVLDPFAHSLRELADCRTVEAADDYFLVQSARRGWFALHMPTGTTCPIESLSVTLAPLFLEQVKRLEATPLSEAFVDEGIRDKYILKAIFLAGAGGSGKGRVSDAMFGGAGLKVINADKYLEKFLKDADIPLEKVGQEYGLFRKAREASQDELRHYAVRRLGLIIDSTGWDYERIATPAKKLRELGYDTYMVFVTTSLETALARNRARGDAGGRKVPDSYVEDAWYGANKNLPRYKTLFGATNMHVIDNDANATGEEWADAVMPTLHNIGQEFLNRPLQNPKGKAWLKKQEDPKTRTLDRLPKKPEWPKPEPTPLPKYSAPAPGEKGVYTYKPYTLPGFLSDVPHYGSGDTGEHDEGSQTPQPGSGSLVLAFTGIPLDEKDWRDDPKDFRTRLKISPEKSAPDHSVCSIGKSAKDGKWYGWSHRAVHGFGVGDRFFPKADMDTEWNKDTEATWPKIKSDAEAKQAAVNFADWVS